MAKAKGGKSKGFISQGKHSNVKSSTLSGMRRARTEAEKMMNKMDALRKGKNPKITVENTNPDETNRRFYRIPLKDLKPNAQK